jgi:hypothetical protein
VHAGELFVACGAWYDSQKPSIHCRHGCAYRGQPLGPLWVVAERHVSGKARIVHNQRAHARI